MNALKETMNYKQEFVSLCISVGLFVTLSGVGILQTSALWWFAMHAAFVIGKWLYKRHLRKTWR